MSKKKKKQEEKPTVQEKEKTIVRVCTLKPVPISSEEWDPRSPAAGFIRPCYVVCKTVGCPYLKVCWRG